MDIQKVSKILNSHKWSIQGFNGTPLYLLYASAKTGWMLKQTFGHDYTHFFYLCPPNRVHMYYDEADWEMLGNDYYKKIKNIKSFHKLENIYRKRFSNSLKMEKQNSGVLPKKNPSNLDLINYAHKCGDVLTQSVGFSHIVEAISFMSEKKLIHILQSKEAHSQRNLHLLTSPIYPSFLSSVQKALWNIKKSEGLKQKKLIENFLKNYSWFENSYVEAKFLTPKQILLNAKKVHRPPVQKAFSKIIKEKAILIKRLKFTKQEKFVVLTIEKTTHWQDNRKKNILIALGVLEKALINLSKRFSIKLHELKCIIPEEITEHNFTNNNFKKKLKLRYKGCAYYATSKNTEIYTGSDFKHFLKIEKNMHSLPRNELKGMVAQKGKVSGIVKICNSLNDIKQIKKGEILVTSMTRPEFLPAMRKAAGFITDEGGITSHAAIVAREMKKPCIIGTKIATKVFKDGDLVEVNADTGVVKKLNSRFPIRANWKVR